MTKLIQTSPVGHLTIATKVTWRKSPVFLSISLEETQLLHIITQTFPVIGRTRKGLKRDACVLTLSQCHKNDRKETICGMTTLFTSHQFLLFSLLPVLHFPPPSGFVLILSSSSTLANSLAGCTAVLYYIHVDSTLSYWTCDKIKLNNPHSKRCRVKYILRNLISNISALHWLH